MDNQDGQPRFSVACGANQTIQVSIQDGVVTVSIQGSGAIADTEDDDRELLAPADDLTRERARRALAEIGYLLTRKEAADYTRRSVQTFDRSLRPHLRNAGTPARPLYLKEEIDRCLHSMPSPGTPTTISESTPGANTTESGSPTKGYVTRSRRAKQNLMRLRRTPSDSTRK